jgi:hypothetical protein
MPPSSAIGCASDTVFVDTTFGDDVTFLRKYVDVLVLKDDKEGAQVAVVPAWQGRVATSTVDGASGRSLGWINRELLASGKIMPHINAFGGEERFWLGPEGSQYSIYFAKGQPFDGEHWFVPPPLDAQPFKTESHSPARAVFQAQFTLSNYAGTGLSVAVKRELQLLTAERTWKEFGLAVLADKLSHVAYQSVNT